MQRTLLEQIVTLPQEFRFNNKSVAECFRDWGLNTHSTLPDAAEIAAYLETHPDLVESWLWWSRNKRNGSGWSFRDKQGKYTVSYYRQRYVMTSDRPEMACAEFILEEIRYTIEIIR